MVYFLGRQTLDPEQMTMPEGGIAGSTLHKPLTIGRALPTGKSRRLAAMSAIVVSAKESVKKTGWRPSLTLTHDGHSGMAQRARPGTYEHRPFHGNYRSVFLGSGLAGCVRAPD
jgi:hypothetical protein